MYGSSIYGRQVGLLHECFVSVSHDKFCAYGSCALVGKVMVVDHETVMVSGGGISERLSGGGLEDKETRVAFKNY